MKNDEGREHDSAQRNAYLKGKQLHVDPSIDIINRDLQPPTEKLVYLLPAQMPNMYLTKRHKDVMDLFRFH